MTDKEQIVELKNQLSLLLKEFSLFKEEMHLKVAVLESENKALKEKLKKYEHPKNSSNSSVPPSQDRFGKTTSSREKSTKQIGGQKGHKGKKLNKVSHPDKTVFHDIKKCTCCGDLLPKEGTKSSRQLVDLPKIKMLVTEHITISKTCNGCGEVNKSKFPKGLVQEAQYGNRVKSFCVY